jgi:carboxymethylenebutenolidase
VPPAPIEDLQNVTGAVLAFNGQNDQRVTGTQPAAEATMRKYNKTFQYVVYPGAGHAFNDDTRPQAYNAVAAKDAYQRSLDWFSKYVKG